ncbi:hypothetical protein AUP68_06265 [Ilyonectria robusta]
MEVELQFSRQRFKWLRARIRIYVAPGVVREKANLSRRHHPRMCDTYISCTILVPSKEPPTNPTEPLAVLVNPLPSMSQPCIEDYTIGWICFLQEEYEAPCRMLDDEFEGPETSDPSDNNTYVFGLRPLSSLVGCKSWPPADRPVVSGPVLIAWGV